MKALSLLTGLVLLLAGCAGMRAKPGPAAAEIKNAQGQAVGTATLMAVSEGVQILVEVRGLPPGEKGVHIHEVGKCDPPAFTSAGGHFNPGKRQHGLRNPAGPHAGDLPNIIIGADGRGRLEITTKQVTLSGGPTALFDADGSALVIHAAPDDFQTDPTGNSGARIACGVIVRSGAASALSGPPAAGSY